MTLTEKPKWWTEWNNQENEVPIVLITACAACVVCIVLCACVAHTTWSAFDSPPLGFVIREINWYVEFPEQTVITWPKFREFRETSPVSPLVTSSTTCGLQNFNGELDFPGNCSESSFFFSIISPWLEGCRVNSSNRNCRSQILTYHLFCMSNDTQLLIIRVLNSSNVFLFFVFFAEEKYHILQGPWPCRLGI